jgi:hypothetical protein
MLSTEATVEMKIGKLVQSQIGDVLRYFKDHPDELFIRASPDDHPAKARGVGTRTVHRVKRSMAAVAV